MTEKDDVQKLTHKGGKTVFPTSLTYPAGEDIHNRSHKEQDIDPGNITGREESTNIEKDRIVPGSENDIPGNELDIPGSEPDDVQENTGSEDEENNYYSIGGDNHNDLDEDKGV